MATPKHVELTRALRDSIARGDPPPGKKLPSESFLMDEWGLSRTTVRTALTALLNEGKVRSESGVGYFVRDLRHFTYRPQDDFRESSTTPEADAFMKAAEKRNPSRQYSVEVAHPDEDVVRRLGLTDGQLVVVRRRTQFLDGEPYQLNDSYYPFDVVKDTAAMIPEDVPEGVNQLLADHGHAQVRALDEIWVRMPSPDEIRRLELGPGTPVAEHIITGLTAESRAVRMVRAILPGDRNVISFDRTHPDHG